MTLPESSPINPYQPTIELPETVSTGEGENLSRGLGTATLFMMTMIAVAASGALFGACVVVISVVVNGFIRIEVGWLLLMALILGGGIAGFSSLFVITGLTLASPLFGWGAPWTRERVRVFAFLSGFGSGMLPIIVLSRLDCMALTFSVVPGAFGGVVSLGLIHLLIRPMPPLNSELPPRSRRIT